MNNDIVKYGNSNNIIRYDKNNTNNIKYCKIVLLVIVIIKRESIKLFLHRKDIRYSRPARHNIVYIIIIA